MKRLDMYLAADILLAFDTDAWVTDVLHTTYMYHVRYIQVNDYAHQPKSKLVPIALLSI